MSKSFSLSQLAPIYENITEVDADAEGSCKVVLTRSYYGLTETSEFAGMEDGVGKPREFKTHAEAQAWIASEAGRQDASKEPTYTIVSA